MVAGMGVGAVAVEGLHAQGKPVVYTVNEIQITDMDAYSLRWVRRVSGMQVANASLLAQLVGEKYAKFHSSLAVEGLPQ